MLKALFTVSFAGLWGQQRLTLPQSIDLTAELGYDGVVLMGKRPHLSVLDCSLDDCKKLNEQIESLGLKVPAIAAYTNFTGGGEAAEVPSVEMQVKYVSDLAERAAIFGCDLVRVFTSYERDDQSFFKQWEQTVSAIRECCDRSGEVGVNIGVQNHHDLAVDTKAYCELLTQIDRTNLIPLYDCWSVHLRGEDIAEGVSRVADRMKLTTVADYVVLPRWRYKPQLVHYTQEQPPAVLAVPMGEGDLDYDTFFSSLVQHGFEGWVSYEMCSPLRGGGSIDNLKSYAKTFLDYMQRFENKTQASTANSSL